MKILINNGQRKHVCEPISACHLRLNLIVCVVSSSSPFPRSNLRGLLRNVPFTQINLGELRPPWLTILIQVVKDFVDGQSAM